MSYAAVGALTAAVALSAFPRAAAEPAAAAIRDLAVAGSFTRATHGSIVTTISPNGDGFRERARIGFTLTERATVTVFVAAVGYRPRTVFKRTLRLGPGVHAVVWRPSAWIQPRTYVVRFVVRDADGSVTRIGYRRGEARIIRVLGIEAAFTRESYRPESVAELRLETDEPQLTLQVFRAGDEGVVTAANDRMDGTAVAEKVAVAGRGSRGRPRRLRVWIGDWPSGVYFAKLTSPKGGTGYAPFIVRPRALGEHRVAVIMPTFTWQAYNFRDDDRDGYGDTWYDDGRRHRTRLGRPYLHRGVPPFFRVYDLNFLRWLERKARLEQRTVADFLTDSDLQGVRTSALLARAYDLIAFPGHHEYVTAREYGLIRGFRDRGGNLMFLSANNFFWRVRLRGRTLEKLQTWRSLRRPEASLLGVQYFGNDRGRRRGAFVVRRSEHFDWAFAGTGLRPGSSFGSFGIEIDHMTGDSPPGTTLLAEVPNLFGRGRTAQMTYYETWKSARVFSAGAFTLAGWAMYEPARQLLENLWARLSRP
jgi:hypothetical protein